MEKGKKKNNEGSAPSGSLAREKGGSRVVTKISSCRVNTTSRRGIKRLGISFGSIFFYFPIKVAGGHSLSSWGKSPTPGPRLLMITLGSSQAFPSPVNCVAHFAQFLFFCCFTLFFASFPHYDDWTGLRLFLLQVLGFAILWYP